MLFLRYRLATCCLKIKELLTNKGMIGGGGFIMLLVLFLKLLLTMPVDAYDLSCTGLSTWCFLAAAWIVLSWSAPRLAAFYFQVRV